MLSIPGSSSSISQTLQAPEKTFPSVLGGPTALQSMGPLVAHVTHRKSRWHLSHYFSLSCLLPITSFAHYFQDFPIVAEAQKKPTFRALHGLPQWLSVKESACQCRRPGFNPWVGKIPWRRERLPTPVFQPGEFHGQRSLVGYSPWGCKESDTTEPLTHTHMHTCFCIIRFSKDRIILGHSDYYSAYASAQLRG